MTLSEHLKAIRDRHDTAYAAGFRHFCEEDGQPWPCADYQDAVAALGLLEASVVMSRIGRAFYDDTDEGQRVLVIPLESP